MAADESVTVMSSGAITDHVAGFVVDAKITDIPKDVAHLGTGVAQGATGLLHGKAAGGHALIRAHRG